MKGIPGFLGWGLHVDREGNLRDTFSMPGVGREASARRRRVKRPVVRRRRVLRLRVRTAGLRPLTNAAWK